MRIIQNQDGFATAIYRSQATPLLWAIEHSALRPLKRLRDHGLVAGIMLRLLRAEHDVVVTLGHRAALAYGMMSRLMPGHSTVHVAREIFIDIPDDDRSRRHRLVRWIYRFALRRVDAIIVNSSGEVFHYARYFDLPVTRFCFLPWPSNINDPHQRDGHDNSVLAAGRSLRDWKTFFRAVDGLPWRFVVIASYGDIHEFDVPSNVTTHFDVPREEFLAALDRAAAVVVPLVKTTRSSGQATFLEAMAYGKATIVADVVGARDYITDGIDGILYAAEDAASLREKICLLMNSPALRRDLGNAGVRSVANRFNKTRYARDLLAFIEECLERKRKTQASTPGPSGRGVRGGDYENAPLARHGAPQR